MSAGGVLRGVAFWTMLYGMYAMGTSENKGDDVLPFMGGLVLAGVAMGLDLGVGFHIRDTMHDREFGGETQTDYEESVGRDSFRHTI